MVSCTRCAGAACVCPTVPTNVRVSGEWAAVPWVPWAARAAGWDLSRVISSIRESPARSLLIRSAQVTLAGPSVRVCGQGPAMKASLAWPPQTAQPEWPASENRFRGSVGPIAAREPRRRVLAIVFVTKGAFWTLRSSTFRYAFRLKPVRSPSPFRVLTGRTALVRVSGRALLSELMARRRAPSRVKDRRGTHVKAPKLGSVPTVMCAHRPRAA